MQNVVDHAIALAPAGMRSLHDLLAQFYVECTDLTLMAVVIAA